MADEDLGDDSSIHNGSIASGREGSSRRVAVPEPKHLNYYNAQLHLALISRDYDDCKAKASEMESETGGRNVEAKVVRGTMAREEGKLEEALHWFTQAMQLAPKNPQYAVQVGRIHFLAGRHLEAIQVLQQAMYNAPDSMCCYWMARSLFHIGRKNKETLEKVREVLSLAPHLNTRPELLRLMAAVLLSLDEVEAAVPVLARVIELEPEESSNYIELAKVLLKNGEDEEGFGMFARALSYSAGDTDALLGVGYVMQKNGDHDVALNKYRISAATNVYDGCLWNNIGMCFYAKGKFVSAISCLKRAAYLNPLEYRILFNLGLSHLAMNQLASSYHFLAASLSLHPNHPDILATLAIVLTRMKDTPNARKAHKKANELKEGTDVQKLWNYAVFEYHEGQFDVSMGVTERILEILRIPASTEEEMMRGQTERLRDELLDSLQRREREGEATEDEK